MKTTFNLISREHEISQIQMILQHVQKLCSLLLRTLNFNFDCIAVLETWLREHSATNLSNLLITISFIEHTRKVTAAILVLY